jgi:flavin-dependent dehydrogenase
MQTTTLAREPTDAPTNALSGATERRWDVLVVGAGPAGSIAARQLARLGLSVLLVDKAQFPRRKVCGCCVGSAAVELLAQIGLPEILPALAAQPIRQLCLAAAGRSAPLALDGGVAVSRDALDAALVGAAVEAGVQFQDGVAAQLADRIDGAWRVELTSAGSRSTIVADAVVAADGIHGGFLSKQPDYRRQPARGSRIGAGAVLADSPAFYRPGAIYMAVGKGGYVGFVRLEDGRLNVAAALDRPVVAAAGKPAIVVRSIVEQAGFPWPGELSSAAWHGTPPLTGRPPCIADHRLFVIGDAAGYIEPFTGEGMTWGILSACEVASLVVESLRGDPARAARKWENLHRRLLGRRMTLCRMLASMLRQHWAASAAIAALASWPGLAAPFVRYIGRYSHQQDNRPAIFESR